MKKMRGPGAAVACVAILGPAGAGAVSTTPHGPAGVADATAIRPALHGVGVCARSSGAATGPRAARTPEEVPLRPTRNGGDARGRMALRMSDSPYGVTVSEDGRYVLHVTVEVSGLRRRSGAAYVVWAATPELDRTVRLGTLGEEGRTSGEVSFNKFLVFVSEEESPDVETWSGPILLTGLSPSGRMHTMAGHGPFEGVDCNDIF